MRKLITAILRAMLLGGSGALSLWSQQPTGAIMAATATSHATADAPRAARALARGTVLAIADMVSDGAASPVSPATVPAIVGWETRRMVKAGEPLRAPAIAPPTLVFANTVVQVVASVDGVKVSRPGTALGAGALGETVRIRLDPHRTITAIVAGVATVRPS